MRGHEATQLFIASSSPSIQRPIFKGGGIIFHGGPFYTHLQHTSCGPEVQYATCYHGNISFCASCELCGGKFHLGSGWIHGFRSSSVGFLFSCRFFFYVSRVASFPFIFYFVSLWTEIEKATSSGDFFPFTLLSFTFLMLYLLFAPHA